MLKLKLKIKRHFLNCWLQHFLQRFGTWPHILFFEQGDQFLELQERNPVSFPSAARHPGSSLLYFPFLDAPNLVSRFGLEAGQSYCCHRCIMCSIVLLKYGRPSLKICDLDGAYARTWIYLSPVSYWIIFFAWWTLKSLNGKTLNRTRCFLTLFLHF